MDFNTETALKIWIRHFGNVEWAKDRAGAWINRDHYGITKELGYGWEVDHIQPVSKGGSDNFSNLRPLQWENNRSKADNYLSWESSVTADNNHNIYKKRDIAV